MQNFVVIADRIKTGVIAVTALIMCYALFVSADHITHVARLIGLKGYQAATLFILIDIVAMVGKVLQLKYFARSTQRLGRKLMIFSGSLSLVCNVTSGFAGGGYGAAAYGAFIVGMFLALEHVVTKIKPAAAVTRAKNAADAPKLSKATAKLTPQQRGAITRKRNAELKALEAEFAA